jgi:hypothetical protein
VAHGLANGAALHPLEPTAPSCVRLRFAQVVSRLFRFAVYLFSEAVPPTRRCASAFPLCGHAGYGGFECQRLLSTTLL